MSPGAARLFYCFASAITLHWFMLKYVSIGAAPLLTLPISADIHFYFSSICMSFAIVSYLSAPETWAMLGTSQVLEWNKNGPIQYNIPGIGMDAISWMALTVVRAGGPIAFIAFSGLSIIPHESTLGDLIMRVSAAIYLRLFSKAFREFVEELHKWHLTTWLLRLSIVFFVFAQGKFDFNSLLFFNTDSSLIKGFLFMIYGIIVLSALRLSETSGTLSLIKPKIKST